jgi:hypothetical protein
MKSIAQQIDGADSLQSRLITAWADLENTNENRTATHGSDNEDLPGNGTFTGTYAGRPIGRHD